MKLKEKIMKTFDLELAKEGHSVQTRDGRPVRIISYDRKCTDGTKIVALIEDIDSIEKPMFYTLEGNYSLEAETQYDLVMSPTKKEGWVNVYKSVNRTYYAGNVYMSEKEAINHKNDFGDTHLSTTRIEWYE